MRDDRARLRAILAARGRAKLLVPAFRTEREETAWWDKHRSEVEADIRAAIREKKSVSLLHLLAKPAQET